MSENELYEFLEAKAAEYNRPDFIATDPISVPHRFADPHDIEIAAFLTAILAWGQRQTIIRSASRLMELMGPAPYEFLKESREEDWTRFLGFVHRTFQPDDCLFFLRSLKQMVQEQGGIKQIFIRGFQRNGRVDDAIRHFRQQFFRPGAPARTRKHLPDIDRGSAAKRINLFLRWMVRNDGKGVDFGLWEEIPPASLYIPLDVHSGRVARMLGLLERKQNDWKAVKELTGRLRQFCPDDPVKYDYALFGTGVFEKF
ncbi:MAG TPA: TIGR02757 family protein [Bacteroidetes bacterium]|nr:TIGR02757 family protein [Bacteroidota bacterium]